MSHLARLQNICMWLDQSATCEGRTSCGLVSGVTTTRGYYCSTTTAALAKKSGTLQSPDTRSNRICWWVWVFSFSISKENHQWLLPKNADRPTTSRSNKMFDKAKSDRKMSTHRTVANSASPLFCGKSGFNVLLCISGIGNLGCLWKCLSCVLYILETWLWVAQPVSSQMDIYLIEGRIRPICDREYTLLIGLVSRPMPNDLHSVLCLNWHNGAAAPNVLLSFHNPHCAILPHLSYILPGCVLSH